MSFEKPVYPFSAIVDQSKPKLALILNAIDPTIGGVLLTGPKGTGKSLAVRALNEILPEVEVAEDCAFHCSPYDPTNMCERCRSRFKDKTLTITHRKMRLIQIPIGATEDRVIGTMDVEKALQKGIRALQPGLRAEANQGILYIDEVNLLSDHLIDAILDAAASGWNVVEREGISITHPSRFILIGSMNPEEGELRPQILDRFGLHAKAEDLSRVEDRIKIRRANEAFGNDALSFREEYREAQKEIIRRIGAARKLLPHVNLPSNILESVAKTCIDLKVDGYRPDIVMVKAAKAHAALNGRDEANLEDVIIASELTLTHRTRNSGLAPPPSSQEISETLGTTPIGRVSLSRKDYLKTLVSRRTIKKVMINALKNSPVNALNRLAPFILLLIFFFLAVSTLTFPSHQELNLISFSILVGIVLIITFLVPRRPRKSSAARLLDFSTITSDRASGSQTIFEDSDEPRSSHHDVEYHGRSQLDSGFTGLGNISDSIKPETVASPKPPHNTHDERAHRGKYYLVGKRAKIVTSSSRGRYVWHELPKERQVDIALGPTIRAAAPYQLSRMSPGLAISIEPEDLRVKMREYRAPFSIILLVDVSLSMASSIVNLGRALLSFHRSVYRRRDRVGLVVFKGSEAVVLQHLTTNLDLVVQKLWKVNMSDFTPMAVGMLKAWQVLKLEKQRNKDAIPMLIIISDGIANIPLSRPLSSHADRGLLSDAQVDVFDVAHLLVRDGMRAIVINTNHRKDELPLGEEGVRMPLHARVYSPSEFLMKLADAVKGSYYGLSLKEEEETIKGTRLEHWFYLE
ncbi:MAG: ATP-binding protein [Candidatus Bathyarchaeota archaeon]